MAAGGLGSRLFGGHPVLAPLAAGGIAGVWFFGFHVSASDIVVGSVAVAISLMVIWHGGPVPRGDWQARARKRWWVVPGIAVFIGLVLSRNYESNRVYIEALGAADTARVTYVTPDETITLNVDIPWLRNLHGINHGDVVTLEVTNTHDDDHVICRMTMGHDSVSESAVGRNSVARCRMTRP